jgi:hypothetical protein
LRVDSKAKLIQKELPHPEPDLPHHQNATKILTIIFIVLGVVLVIITVIVAIYMYIKNKNENNLVINFD